MKNSSLAMISTIAIVVAFASITAYIDPGACVNEPSNTWTSCESVAHDKWVAFWISLSIAVASYVTYLVQKFVYRNSSDN